MKGLLQSVLVGLICLFSVATWAGNSATANYPKTIRFATEATYPPFEYVDATGQIQGFDISIAKALCVVLNAQCTFSNQPFASLIPSLQLGKFDAIIAALDTTPERVKQVAFTQSYYQPGGSFVAASSQHYTLNNVIGKTIAVQTGSTFQQYVNDVYGNKVTTKTYASIQDAYLDLVAGRVDMVFADTPIAMTWLKQNDNSKTYSIVGKPITDYAYFGKGYAIAVRKDDQPLLAALNQALATIKTNGTYAAILKQYFSK